MERACLFAVVLVLVAMGPLRAADYMKAFPPPQKGMTRYVVNLPEQEDEHAFKVELIAGKTVYLDKGNRYFFGGRIIAENIKGWGFTRYTLKQLGPMVGTRMAVDPSAPKVDRFIALGGEPYLVRYNSRLPLVVYVPEGVQVRYRVWSAKSELRAMEEG